MKLSIQPYGSGTMMVSASIDVDITRASGITHRVKLPVGYVFDGASIPRCVWSVIGHPFDPSFVVAACVHDWYCDQAKAQHDYQLRVIGDAVFFALLTKAGVPGWKRAAMYIAVRCHAFFSKRGIYKK